MQNFEVARIQVERVEAILLEVQYYAPIYAFVALTVCAYLDPSHICVEAQILAQFSMRT